MAEKKGAHGENAEDPETSESKPPERRSDHRLKQTISQKDGEIIPHNAFS